MWLCILIGSSMQFIELARPHIRAASQMVYMQQAPLRDINMSRMGTKSDAEYIKMLF